MQYAQRPLSPHLTIYRPLVGAFTSILHRALNVALFAGTAFLALWLVAVAVGGDFYTGYTGFLGSFLGQIMLFGWTFCALFYAAQGIRHFAWDLGYGFELETARLTGWAALAFAAGGTLLIWLIVAIRGVA